MLCPPLARGTPVELRVLYEDKDTPDHTGEGAVPARDPGIAVEMVALLAEHIPELRIRFARRPWARCLAELGAGQADAIFSSSFKPERQQIGAYPMQDGRPDRRARLDTKSYSLYKLRGRALSWNGQHFSPQRPDIIAMRGYSIVDDLRALGAEVREVEHSALAYRMLLRERVDGFAQLTPVGDYTLARTPEFGAIVKLEPPLIVKDYYLQIGHDFQRRHPGMSRRIWSTLGQIREAELERLYLKYMGAYTRS
jgi:polar amino acid transport system substrate-binding protein